MNKHAQYTVLNAESELPELPHNSVLIRDVGHESGPSVTNDAEWVLRDLVNNGLVKDRHRVFYFDSEDNVDEMTHRAGRFTGFSPGPFRPGSPMGVARATLASMPKRSVVKLKKAGLARVLNGVDGMTFPVENAHFNVRHDVVIVHVRDYRYPSGRGWQTWSMHLGEDCELVDFETTQGVRI